MNVKTVPAFLLLTGCGLLLYAPFLAIQYDTNGVLEAESLESGVLVSHNHMAYRPIGNLLYNAAQMLGYSGTSLLILQFFNAVCGALSVGFCYVSFERLLQSRVSAVIASLWWGTTFTAWYVSTDVTYMGLASLFASAAIALSVRGNKWMHAVASGVLAAACVVTWQAGIFLIPGLIALWFLKSDRRPIWYLIATSSAVTLAIYIVVGISYFDVTNVMTFFQWALRYGSAGTLPMWGHWGMDRIPAALHSAMRSLTPTPLLVNPIELLHHRVQLGRIAVDLSVVAILFLLAGGIIRIKTIVARTQRRAAVAFVLGYAAFLPFIIWWDPEQPIWSIAPNIFLAGFLGAAWDSPSVVSRSTLLFIICTAGIALTNFVVIIHPRHAELGPDRTIAQCVSEHTSERDLIVAAEWGWPDYMWYLHHRQVLNLINSSLPFTNKADHLAMVRDSIVEIQRQGGTAIMRAPEEYKGAHLAWLETQTRLKLSDLQTFPLVPGFSCAGQEMKIVGKL